MIQLDQQSRWQSWMRVLAVDIHSVPESDSLIGFTGSRASAWRHAAIKGRTSLAIEPKSTSINAGRSNESTD